MKNKTTLFAIALLLSGCSDSASDAAVAAANAAELAAAANAANAADAAAATESGKPELTPEQKKEGEEMIALLLNLNSLLCAKVVEVNPLKVRPGVLEVKCIEYRGGTATKNYIVDTNNGTAFPQ